MRRGLATTVSGTPCSAQTARRMSGESVIGIAIGDDEVEFTREVLIGNGPRECGDVTGLVAHRGDDGDATNRLGAAHSPTSEMAWPSDCTTKSI